MQKNTINRVLKIADYILENDVTIRELATIFEGSKSNIHLDLRLRLPKIDKEKAKKVHLILEEHNKCKHLKGGEETRKKWEKIREAR